MRRAGGEAVGGGRRGQVHDVAGKFGVRDGGAGGGEVYVVRLVRHVPPPPLNLHDQQNKRFNTQDLVNTWVTCKILHPLQLDAAAGVRRDGAWRKCFVEVPVSIVVGVSRGLRVGSG